MDSNEIRGNNEENTEKKVKSRKSKILDFAQENILIGLGYANLGLVIYALMNHITGNQYHEANSLLFASGMLIGNDIAQYSKNCSLSKILRDDIWVFMGSLAGASIYDYIVR